MAAGTRRGGPGRGGGRSPPAGAPEGREVEVVEVQMRDEDRVHVPRDLRVRRPADPAKQPDPPPGRRIRPEAAGAPPPGAARGSPSRMASSVSRRAASRGSISRAKIEVSEACIWRIVLVFR